MGERNEVRLPTLDSYAVQEARKYQRMGPTLTEQKAAENDGTMVTVVCITYNHEKYIAQALDSFLMQKTNFKFKVFVGEDHGPDGTADIVRQYAERYPDVIVPFLREENMGAQHNLIDLCQHATSPYIAFCEGDDYWIDEYKLQKQVDFMEEHPKSRVCFMQTRAEAPDTWHLRSWYKAMPGGEVLIPDSIPGYKEAASFSPSYFINRNVAHTSTYFFRWNYDLPIPEWYYGGVIGDAPLLLLQLGSVKLDYIKGVSSVYRVNMGSAFYNENREEHFLNTRLNYVHYLPGLRDFAKIHFRNYPIVPIENRIKLEAANYLQILIKRNDTDAIADFFAQYPEAGKISLNAYLSFYRDSRAMTACWSWPGYQLAARNKYCRNLLKPVILTFGKLDAWRKKVKEKKKKLIVPVRKRWTLLRGKAKNLVSLLLYWWNTAVPKENDLWVFSGFNKRSYMDNSKYFYEYVLEHHPELRAVWLTLDKSVFDKLTEEGKPVVMMRTPECRRILSRAAIAVTDHFRMSDYDALSGLNDRTKVVQLWHGVGLKSMTEVIELSTIPGVMFSSDILPGEKDGFWQKIAKRAKYFRYAYYRELFEKYFILVCPGQERVEQIAKPLHIPLENCVFSGHSRNVHLHSQQKNADEFKILYAPTFRWNVVQEREIVRQLEEAADRIEDLMAKRGAEFVIRMHPHTWRNYSKRINAITTEHEHISFDCSKDIYPVIGQYDVLVSDYSSISFDFVMVDKPVVFFCFDLDDYMQHEGKLNYDYDVYSPGVKTKTWEETLEAVTAYLENPTKDSAWRQRVRDEFFDMSVNDENNSERIVQEIKRRLSEERQETQL